MPQGRSQRFRMMLSGLLFLSMLAVSVVQTHAAVLLIEHGAASESIASHNGSIAGATSPLTDHRSGVPCNGHHATHGLVCCCSGCSMFSGSLPAPAVISLTIASTTLVYLDASTTRPDGLPPAPTLPPPRHIV